MLDNVALNVVIGLVFIFLLYGLLATAVQEAISTILHRRANTLYDGIKSMLSNTKKDKGGVQNFIGYLFIDLPKTFWEWLQRSFTGKKKISLSAQFYDHPIIKNYGQNRLYKKPSYLTSENFSSILIETLKNLDNKSENITATFSLLKTNVEDKENKEALPIDDDTRQILMYHLNEAAGDLDVFKYRIEKWFNDSMDRVSGWYKRNTQLYLFSIGLIMAIGLNIDSIQISKYLSENKTAREQLANMGIAAANNPNLAGADSVIAKEALDSIKANINTVNTLAGLGWGDYGIADKGYRADRLDDTSSKIYHAYKSLKNKAAIIFKKDFDSIQNRLLSDSVNKKTVAKIIDSLNKNKTQIIEQTQFTLLYKDKAFKNSLKRNYVLYQVLTWEKFFSFLITALAISLGAPFWFDLLNKIVSIRTAVKTVDSSGSTTKNNTSNDNQTDG